MPAENLSQRVEAVRRFNRFYTRQIGVLHEGFADSPFSLTEVRVLYELAHRERPTAAEIGEELRLDPGYLSRILSSFEKRKLIDKQPSEADGRQTLLSLTQHGRDTFAPIQARSVEQLGLELKALSEAEQDRLIAGMGTIERVLRAPAAVGGEKSPYLLRPNQPGDMGWIVHRHGVLYAQEYGYDETFEAFVAEIVAKFLRRHDAKRERCWIAERDGDIVGSIFVVAASKKVAKLRLLLVEPSARGLGIGGRLVSECVRFARLAGYQKMVLWTQSDLDAARHIYKKAGFRVTHKEQHHSFGKDLVAETWEMAL